MMIIEYDKNGWVCFRYPYDLDEPVGELEVSEEQFEKTMSCPTHYAWRVVNGGLVCEQYEEIPEKEADYKEYKSLLAQLSASDYKAIKYVEGEYTEEEYAPIRAERAALRARAGELKDKWGFE